MAHKPVKEISSFFEGIADFPKLGGSASYASGRSVDHRTDPRSISLLPRTIKESGTVVTDLPKWSTTPPTTCKNTYIYGNAGNIYQRDLNGSYTYLRTVPNSHGNGINWFGEDNFIYYTSDSLVGRYGPICNNPTFNDDFFGSQGGARTNTNSLELLSASTQYASRASTASLQITGDLSINAQIYPYSLPTTGESMTLVSKWTEDGDLRSYKFDIAPVSNYFGDGSDGALTVNSPTTEAPIDSACTGTINTQSLSATNAGFASGQEVLIIQMTGTGAGTWMRNTIQSYTAGTITLVNNLNATYSSGAQVRVLPQYTDVTINSTYTAKAWNGTVGGILAFIANGTISGSGTITGAGKGFRGGAGVNGSGTAGKAYQGEGTSGTGSLSRSANANGGGGGADYEHGGGGGGNGVVGSNGQGASGGIGGSTSGTADLTTMVMGGGGGGSCFAQATPTAANGGAGGAILFLSAATWSFTGSITSNGANGEATNNASGIPRVCGGGGAGGSILIKSQVATLGSGLITASGGTGGQASGGNSGGNGGAGRIHLDYYTSYTGTTTPTLDAIQDNNLGSSDGHVIRLQVSDDGAAVETYSRPITLSIDTWQQVGVSWDASTSTAEFCINGVTLGTQVGTMNSIDANASVFNVGRYLDGSSTTSGLYNGLIDEVQVFSIVRSVNDFLLSIASEIVSTTTGLAAYYKFNASPNDSTANANNLTLTGTPSYSTNTPFIGATDPINIDQSQTLSGNTYTTPTTITENAANTLEFTPTKDPQKSVSVTIVAIGTGDWTLTIHDQYNNTIASKTVANASLSTGVFEFIFSSAWRPQINEEYHFHITSTVADGTVQTGTNADLSTVWYRTYYGFLVEDTQYHPIAPMLQFLCFGNERYVATLEATLYNPNAITLPAGWKIRCFAYWNEYLAIGTWQGDTVDEYDSGRIFFWDGISPTYNFFIDVPEGAINAMQGSRGKLFFIAGSRCKLLVYEGGAQARKLKNLVNSDNTDVIDIFPGAMTMWQSLMRIGVAGNNDDADAQQGVYTWGSVNERYPDSLSFDYPISTGTYTGNTVKIGLVTTVNSRLLIGWQDNVSFGVDYVDVSNPVYPQGEIDFLIEDDGAMYHEKEAITITSQYEPLASGQSITLQYKLDRADNWTQFTADSETNSITQRRQVITNGSRYREYEISAILETSNTSDTEGAKMLSISIEKDTLSTETRVG